MPVSNPVVIGASIGAAVFGVLVTSAVAAFLMYRRETKEELTRARHRLGEEIALNPEIGLIAAEEIADVCYNNRGLRAGVLLKKPHVKLDIHVQGWVRLYAPVNVLEGCTSGCAVQHVPNTAEFERLAGKTDEWERVKCNDAATLDLLSAFVGRVISARMDPNGDPETTLLPPILMQVNKYVSAFKDTEDCE